MGYMKSGYNKGTFMKKKTNRIGRELICMLILFIIIIIGIAVGVAIPNIFNQRHIEKVKQKRVARLLALRDED